MSQYGGPFIVISCYNYQGAQAAYSNPPAGMSRDNATLAYVTELFAKQSSWSDYSTRHSDYEQIERWA